MPIAMEPRVLSPPIKVYWAGWESDTRRLGDAGWRISAKHEPYDGGVTIAINHPEGNVYGISQRIDYRRMPTMYQLTRYDYPYELAFQLQLAQQIMLRTIPDFKKGWVPVDPIPELTYEHPERLEDVILFRSLPPPDKDIIVKPPSLDDILNLALEHQAPKQAELREKARHKMGAIIRVAA